MRHPGLPVPAPHTLAAASNGRLLMVALIFRTLSAFLVFDVVYIMSNGGPGTSTTTLAYLDFNDFHVNNDYGYGGAILAQC